MVSLILHSIDARKNVADLFFSSAYYYFHNKLDMLQVQYVETDRTPPVVRPKPLLRFILKATKLTMSLGNSSNTFSLCLFIEINRL